MVVHISISNSAQVLSKLLSCCVGLLLFDLLQYLQIGTICSNHSPIDLFMVKSTRRREIEEK